MSLINLLACEVELIQSIHHQQEIDKLPVDGMSNENQLEIFHNEAKGYYNTRFHDYGVLYLM